MLAQGTPLLYGGDEFGNSQNGNNNAYCQDNRISWLDWSQMAKNKELVDYVSRLIEIRNNNLLAEFESKHPIASGIPEISYHGVKPWATDGLSYNRTAGIMIASKGLYIAINMDGNKHEFELPKLYDECQWKLHISTSDNHNEGFVLPSETIAIYLC